MKKGVGVDLVVSQGPARSTCRPRRPTARRGEGLAGEERPHAAVLEQNHDTVPAGSVVSQAPAPGECTAATRYNSS